MRRYAHTLFYGLFCCMALAAAGFYILENYELKTLNEYNGFQGEAKENRLFAARLLLRRMGIDAQRSIGLPTLPETASGTNATVIVLNTQRHNLSEGQIDQLLAWVERGGHLLAVARTHNANSLLDQLRDQEKSNDSSELRDPLQTRLGIYTGKHHMTMDEDLPIQITWEGVPETLALEMDFYYELRSVNPTSNQHNTAHKPRLNQIKQTTWLIQKPYGSGQVSMVGSLGLFENHSLGQADHAKFFWYLLHDATDKSQPLQRVWLVDNDQKISIFSLLWQHARPVLLLLLLGILLFFWAKIPRFGALIPSPVAERRRISDHIHASGRFYWKQQKSTAAPSLLVDSARRILCQAAKRHIPGWDLLNTEQQLESLQSLLDAPPARENLQQLMNADHLKDHQFIELVKIARALRNTA